MSAQSKMVSARTSLILESPFFGHLALSLNLKADTGCETAWVDGRTLGYNPAFIESLPHEQITALIAHEVMHCALGHPWRRDGRNSYGWNVAADRAINHDLKGSGFKLPPGALYPSADEEGKSAEWIYARQDENQDGNGKSKPDPLGELRDAPNGPDEDGNPAPSEQDWKQKMAEALNSAKMAGKVPGGLARLVKEALRPRVDVRSLLLRFFSERSNADYSWSRPNSRYIAQGLYLPSLESSALGEIAVLCDTSGSVDETSLAYARSILEQVLDEVNPAGVTLYMVDTEVHTVHRMERGDLLTWEPKGGGGTDFSSFFETVETGDIQPVCVIGISDLYANFGETVPSVPVLWLSTTDMIAPFGETVSLPV